MNMPSPILSELAQKYHINTQKPFFPINSLRLLYFLITDFASSGDQVVMDKVDSLIPKVEAVFSARLNARSAQDASPQNDWLKVQEPLQEVFKVVDTPQTRAIFNQLITYLYPLQDETFQSIFQQISQSPTIPPIILTQLLRIRAMDSIIFSTLISELLPQSAQFQNTLQTKQIDWQKFVLALEFQLHLAYKINDLADAIVFAKDDLESNSFSPFQVIRKIAPESGSAKELIQTTFDQFRSQAAFFPFPPELQQQVQLIYDELINVIKGN
jgi:hypothetical protein